MNGADFEALMLEVKDLRIATERSADALEQLVEIMAAHRAGAKEADGFDSLKQSDEKLLRSLLPVVLGQNRSIDVQVSDMRAIADCPGIEGADMRAALGGKEVQAAGTALGRAAAATAQFGNVGGFKVVRAGDRAGSAVWRISRA